MGRRKEKKLPFIYDTFMYQHVLDEDVLGSGNKGGLTCVGWATGEINRIYKRGRLMENFLCAPLL